MKIIDEIKKEYQQWKWLRQAMKEVKARKKEAEEKRKKEWKRFFYSNKI